MGHSHLCLGLIESLVKKNKHPNLKLLVVNRIYFVKMFSKERSLKSSQTGLLSCWVQSYAPDAFFLVTVSSTVYGYQISCALLRNPYLILGAAGQQFHHGHFHIFHHKTHIFPEGQLNTPIL